MLPEKIRLWIEAVFMVVLQEIGFLYFEYSFTRNKYDNCVCVMSCNGSFMYLLFNIDDLLITSRDLFEINMLKGQLYTKYKMEDLGVAKKILGMEK